MMKRKSFTEEQIIKVLGVGAPKAAARVWAAGTPNIVNVAVSRGNKTSMSLARTVHSPVLDMRGQWLRV
jgi:hypothetical protein